jgi:hypothetical protein
VALAIGAVASPVVAKGPQGATIVKGPYITGLSDHGATVRFELSAARPATVQVTRNTGAADAGLRTAGVGTVVTPGTATLQLATVTNLRPGTSYEYVTSVGGLAVAKGHFKTAPEDDSTGPLTFCVYGDDRSDPAAHASVVHGLMQASCDFLINTGDLVQSGADPDDWQSFFDIEAPLLRDHPIFVSIGNHELFHEPSGATFVHYFGYPGEGAHPATPYGTARVGNVRFFFLDAMHDWGSGEERQWLERELALADAEPSLVWRIVVAHAGPWSVGPHGPNEKLVSGHVPELLAEHKVDLFLSGHDHLYARGDASPTKYIVSGGGGAPLYSVVSQPPHSRRAVSAYHFVEVTTDGDSLRIVARRPDGGEIDRCGMVKGGPWDCDARGSALADPSHAPGASAADNDGEQASLTPAGVPVAPAVKQRNGGCGISESRWRAGGSREAGEAAEPLGPEEPAERAPASLLGSFVGLMVAIRIRRFTRRG